MTAVTNNIPEIVQELNRYKLSALQMVLDELKLNVKVPDRTKTAILRYVGENEKDGKKMLQRLVECNITPAAKKERALDPVEQFRKDGPTRPALIKTAFRLASYTIEEIQALAKVAKVSVKKGMKKENLVIEIVLALYDRMTHHDDDDTESLNTEFVNRAKREMASAKPANKQAKPVVSNDDDDESDTESDEAAAATPKTIDEYLALMHWDSFQQLYKKYRTKSMEGRDREQKTANLIQLFKDKKTTVDDLQRVCKENEWTRLRK